MTATKTMTTMIAMLLCVTACATEPDTARTDQEVAVPAEDELVIGGCDPGFCPDENSPGNCQICTGGGGGGGGDGGGGFPTGGGGGGGAFTECRFETMTFSAQDCPLGVVCEEDTDCTIATPDAPSVCYPVQVYTTWGTECCHYPSPTSTPYCCEEWPLAPQHNHCGFGSGS